MENTNQYPDGFESWIRNKTWSELNADELKQLQDEQISETDFQQLKQMLIQLELIDEDVIQPKDELKDALLAAFDKGPGKPGRVISMPVWITTFAVAAAVLVFFVWFMPGETSRNNVADIPQINKDGSNQASKFESSDAQDKDSNNSEMTEEAIMVDQTDAKASAENATMPSANESEDIVLSESTVEVSPGVHPTNCPVDDVAETKATSTASMAQNFSQTTTIQSSQLFSSGSTAQNFDQPLVIVTNTTLASNKSMLDVLITVY
jgi:cytoskeletal protein RodZ